MSVEKTTEKYISKLWNEAREGGVTRDEFLGFIREIKFLYKRGELKHAFEEWQYLNYSLKSFKEVAEDRGITLVAEGVRVPKETAYLRRTTEWQLS